MEGTVTLLSIFIISLAGWLTHIYYCFTHHEYVLLLAGAIVARLEQFTVGVVVWAMVVHSTTTRNIPT